MKKLITAIALTAICYSAKAQDTFKVKYVLVRYELKYAPGKRGPLHRVKADYIVKQQDGYLAYKKGEVVGRIDVKDFAYQKVK